MMYKTSFKIRPFCDENVSPILPFYTFDTKFDLFSSLSVPKKVCFLILKHKLIVHSNRCFEIEKDALYSFEEHFDSIFVFCNS